MAQGLCVRVGLEHLLIPCDVLSGTIIAQNLGPS
jgi:hypothetical protein